jgi:two-component system response regulator LytT
MTKAWHHILFWIIVYASLTLIFTDWFEGAGEAFYYVSLLMPVVLGTSYFFNYYLVPHYLFKRRFLLLGLYSFYMLVVSVCLELVAGIVAMLLMVQYGVSETGSLVTDVFTMAGILYFVVLIMSFILLIRHYFVDQQAIVSLEERQAQQESGYFTIRSNRQTMKVRFDELLYVESLDDYIKMHMAGGEELVSKERISHMELTLPDSFVRIHRSFIVNQEKISSFTREHVVAGGKELPISRTYKQEVVSRLSISQSL